ncbi:MAG: type II toxin -antitoxin system TacA 1-like antitoxin [Methylomagnum sp.]
MMTKAELENQLTQEIHDLSFEAMETLLRLTALLKGANTPQNAADIDEQAILAQERAVYLRTEEDIRVFLEALENPPKPNEALKEAAKLHREMVSNSNEEEREWWSQLSRKNLARAYDDNEPEYSLEDIRP